MKQKWLPVITFLILLLISILGGCKRIQRTSDPALSMEPDTILTFYSWASGSEKAFTEAMIRQYEKENKGIKIEANFVLKPDYLSKISILNAEGKMPDVFLLPESNVYQWGKKGVLHEFEEGVYGARLNYVTMCLYYNKELLKAEGITPPSVNGEVWTWDEYVENAKRLTVDMSGKNAFQDGFNEKRVKTYGTRMPTSWEAITALAVSAGDSEPLSGGYGKLHFSDEKIHVIQSIADLSLSHHCAPDHVVANSTYTDAAAMLMSGRLALFIGTSRAFADYANRGFDVGVAPLPYFKTASDIKWSEYVCVSEQSEHKGDAVDFTTYFSDYLNALKVSEQKQISLGFLPQYEKVYTDEGMFRQWVSSYPDIDALEACETFSDILTSDRTVNIKKIEGEGSDLLDQIMENIWLGSFDANSVLEGAD